MNEEKLIALIDILIDERIQNIPSIQGKRGLRGLKGNAGKDGLPGKDGESFTWDKFKDQILLEIKNNAIIGPQGERGTRGLKGLDGKDGLNGKDGIDGKDGKSFDWNEHKDSISKLIEKHRLKFENLTQEQKDELRGERGPRGQRGKPGVQGEKGEKGDSFIWDEHQEKIFNKIEQSKLKFSDLSDEEKLSLKGDRGPRGQRGKPGINGFSAYEIWNKENEGTIEDFLNSLKGKNGVPGLPGLNGRDGQNGLDGQDGLDAPKIIDIRVIELKDKFFFKFYFDDGSVIETNKVDLPQLKKILQVSDQRFQIELKDYQNTTIEYDEFQNASEIRNYFDPDKKYLASIENITYQDNFIDYIIERIYNGTGADENEPNSLIATNKIDIMYTDFFVNEIKVTEQ